MADYESSQLIRIEHPVRPRTRNFAGTAGGDALAALISAGDERYQNLLRDAIDVAALLSPVPIALHHDPRQPHWDNGWFPPLDAILLAQFIAANRPKTYLEIGSGNSTKFARYVVNGLGLKTRMVSIDPHPRAEIDEICDRVVRDGLESEHVVDCFRQLEPGDVVLFDGSHYCFQNSDVAVFFVELLHEIPPGCVYGIHDIFLPDDYPVEWLDRFYNEQYMLAAWLLGGANRDEIAMPAAYVSSRARFADAREQLITTSGAGPERHGAAFWMTRG
jgi:hypothetical protein